ncbi:unnamed protein product [Paramecium primaurelia]|uniref:Transmembrane protein n=1 Tax=Paramecium primaurelia TaxID=5886 RepID=A0A8S1P3X7_PARPR|nr:unnamed protein product [Paramecium primaurelia]
MKLNQQIHLRKYTLNILSNEFFQNRTDQINNPVKIKKQSQLPMRLVVQQCQLLKISQFLLKYGKIIFILKIYTFFIESTNLISIIPIFEYLQIDELFPKLKFYNLNAHFIVMIMLFINSYV